MKKVLPICLVLFLMAFIISSITTPLIRNIVEHTLVGQTQKVLLASGIPAAATQVSYKHHFLQIPSGVDFETQSKIIELVNSKVPGAYVPQLQAPLRVTADRSADGSITLSGFVPSKRVSDLWSDLAQANLKEGAALDNQIVVDGTVVDPNWNQGFYDYVNYYLATPGIQSISVDQNAVTLEGEVISPYLADELAGMAENIIGSEISLRNELTYRQPQDKILPFSLERVKGDRFVLKGIAPDSQSKVDFGKELANVLKDESIIISNQLTVDHRVYPNGVWALPVQRFAAHFSSISGVTKLVADEHSISLFGEVLEDNVKSEVGKLAKASIGKTDQVFNNITIKKTVPEPIKKAFAEVEPKAPEFPPLVAKPVEKSKEFELVTGKFKDTAIYFETNSAVLTTAGVAQAQQLSEIIKDSDLKTKLVVGGYADNRGNAEFNKSLSLRRAQAVKAHLVTLGIPEGRMNLKHFGEDTSNISVDDLWKSRRVELSLETEIIQ